MNFVYIPLLIQACVVIRPVTSAPAYPWQQKDSDDVTTSGVSYQGSVTINSTEAANIGSNSLAIHPLFKLKCDTRSQLKQHFKIRKMWEEILKKVNQNVKGTTFTENTNATAFNLLNQTSVRTVTSNVSMETNTTARSGSRSRQRRWDYDESYDWENGGRDYSVPGDPNRKETKLEKIAKSWQKNAIKFIFVFSFLSMILCCCLAACKKFFTRIGEVICSHCVMWRDMCLNRDPTYRMIRKYGDDYGLKLDYSQYKKIKKSYEESLKKYGHSNVDLSGRR